MNISIGILACNEADTLPGTLNSLFQQSLCQGQVPWVNDPAYRLEVIVVANGCTDATATVATSILEALAHPGERLWFHWQVYEVEQPGKSNAWNRYVHDYAAPAADYLILMDADIEFIEPQTLEQMVSTLVQHPEAWVAIDTPIKDIQRKPNPTLLERLSLKASATSSSETAICGQLYCGRAEPLRAIWMPPGLSVEDGFLRAMVVTHRFTQPEQVHRIQRAPQAAHHYTAYVTPGALLRHEKRLVLGSTLNAFLYQYLWDHATPEQDAGVLICQNNHRNPQWFHQLVEQAIQERGWWLIPKAFWFRRFRSLKREPGRRRWLRFPVVLMASCLDWWVFWQANREIHRRGGLNYW